MRIWTWAVLGAALGVPSIAGAEPSAQEIANAALDNNMFSTDNARATIDMEIFKSGKVVRERKIATLVKRQDGLIKSFVEFLQPADVAGTKFLSLEETSGDTRQFIYLPAFKKVKRVVGAQRGQSFMGTDFAYSDLEGRDVAQYEWKRLPDQKYLGEDCYVIESKPKDAEKESYGRSVLWVHKSHMIPVKSEFFDKKGSEVEKRLEVKKLAQKDGRWIAMESVMETLKKESQTRLKVTSIDLKTPIPDEALTREALER
jgi:outer membrane lipoprotein-sorting protein